MGVLDYDYIVIGSGFGGSVSALRLVEKGYKVALLECGKRYQDHDFPKTTWNLPRFLWFPLLKWFGIFRLTFLKHVLILSGVGVGGGSLVYGNTLLVPPEEVWSDPQWSQLKDWKKVMPTFYQLAKKMLGVISNPFLGSSDLLLQQAAQEISSQEKLQFKPTEVGVYFGTPGVTVPDPFFAGEGPARTGCTLCGGCMVGCRHGAKNTLSKNYLYLAERRGLTVFPETEVLEIRPLKGNPTGGDGYQIITRSSTMMKKKQKQWTTNGVVVSAGVLGTMKLLMSSKQKDHLPHLSSRLGQAVRTNSESIIGVQHHKEKRTSPWQNFHQGVAIGSGVYLDSHTHVEAVRYPKGPNALLTLATPMPAQPSTTPPLLTRWLTFISWPWRVLLSLHPLGWAENSLILLVMQSLDNQLELVYQRKQKKVQTKRPEGSPIPPLNIPQANHLAQRMAKKIGGKALTSIFETVWKRPMTAHILGGAPMGQNDQEGVIDSNCRVYNYENFLICDGSIIGANLGVNPSLTITALSEQAMSHIPHKHHSTKVKANDNEEN